MVLLAGPRQCGKTVLAKELAKKFNSSSYYNWDIAHDRKKLIAQELETDHQLWIFDEIHKYKRWRNWLKGVYDGFSDQHSILVTGSAKLDVYSRGGDSLQGRYFFHRMHPLTLSEVQQCAVPDFTNLRLSIPSLAQSDTKAVEQLFELGGFPEPFLSGSATQSQRWRSQYGTRLVREEVRSLEKTEDLDTMEVLFERLSECVAAPLSINNLREDLELAHGTVVKWVAILENLYGVFRIYPYGPPRIKALKKEAKLYFWDWARVSDPGARFENLVAVHLLAYCHWMQDQFGKKFVLRYFRSKSKHEVDFVILDGNKPVLAIEAKLKEQSLDPGFKYFLERVDIPSAYQIALHSDKDYVISLSSSKKVRLLPAAKFLKALV